MTKREKRLKKIRQNPKTVSFDDLRSVLEDHGFDLIRSAGSHFHFRVVVKDQPYGLTIPYKKPYIKEVYVKRAIALIDKIIEAIQETEDQDDD